MWGKHRTGQWKKNQSERMSGENNPMFGKKVKRVTCEHCNKEVAINGYAQWHGDKCKSNLTSLVANTDR